MKDPVTKAEDAIDAIYMADAKPSDQLNYLLYVARYAMARFHDVLTVDPSASMLVEFATHDSLPPLTERGRRRQQRKERESLASS